MTRTAARVRVPTASGSSTTSPSPSYDPARTVERSVDRAHRRRHAAATPDLARAAESGAAWSPDSRRIAFSDEARGGRRSSRSMCLRVDGGEARRVTTLPTARPVRSGGRRARRMLFESMLKAARPAPDKSTARAFDTMPIRFWNAWLDGSKPHLFVQELDGGAAADWLAGTKLAASPGFDGLFTGDGAPRDAAARVVARRPGDRVRRRRRTATR